MLHLDHMLRQTAAEIYFNLQPGRGNRTMFSISERTIITKGLIEIVMLMFSSTLLCISLGRSRHPSCSPDSYSQVGLVVEDLAVVPVDVVLQVGHTPVAHLHCILIDYLVEGVVFWEFSTDNHLGQT